MVTVIRTKGRRYQARCGNWSGMQADTPVVLPILPWLFPTAGFLESPWFCRAQGRTRLESLHEQISEARPSVLRGSRNRTCLALSGGSEGITRKGWSWREAGCSVGDQRQSKNILDSAQTTALVTIGRYSWTNLHLPESGDG